MSVLERNNVHVAGANRRAMVFVHGFGCDQQIWRSLEQSFKRDFATILLDHVGCGGSQLPSYSSSRYSTIEQYSRDLVEVGDELGLDKAVLVGHSFGAIVAVLASIQAPSMFDELILISPNARLIDEGSYSGGFSVEQAQAMLRLVDLDYQSWSSRMAPILVNDPEHPEIADQLEASLHRQDPLVAKDLARVVLHTDVRGVLDRVRARTLVIQGSGDMMAPKAASAHVSHRIGCELICIDAKGYLPHISAPRDSMVAMMDFLREGSSKKSSSGVVNLRDFVRTGAKALAISAGSHAGHSSQDNETLDSLLARTGELWMHIGRYDMYAFSFQQLLHPGSSLDVEHFDVRSRGEDIRCRLAPLSGDLSQHFNETDRELKEILARNSPAARYGATIGGMSTVNFSSCRDKGAAGFAWYDQVNAGVDDWQRALSRVERDILRMVALCFRVCQCALQTQRLLSQEDTLQQRAIWIRTDE